MVVSLALLGVLNYSIHRHLTMLLQRVLASLLHQESVNYGKSVQRCILARSKQNVEMWKLRIAFLSCSYHTPWYRCPSLRQFTPLATRQPVLGGSQGLQQ